MADKTGIEWTDATWNPLRGCTRVSEGCRNCYAETVAARFSGPGQPYEGLARWVDRPGETREARWTGKVALVEKVLDQPLRWKRPRRIFVNSMADLFHEAVPDEWIDRIFAVMALAPQHTFQILTKRPERMREYLSDSVIKARIAGRAARMAQAADRDDDATYDRVMDGPCPLPNVWLGVSIEDQKAADERIPLLLETPAAIRWISAEPLLGGVNLTRIMRSTADWVYCDNALTGFRAHKAGGSEGNPRLDWVVLGGESGDGARPMHPDWARKIRDDCAAAGVPFLFKQWSELLIAEPVYSSTDPDQIDFWRFADGDEFHIVSDGHDIVMCNAHDSKICKQIWRSYWADGHGHLAKRIGKKAAGRLLDGVLHDGYPKVRHGAR